MKTKDMKTLILVTGFFFSGFIIITGVPLVNYDCSKSSNPVDCKKSIDNDWNYIYLPRSIGLIAFEMFLIIMYPKVKRDNFKQELVDMQYAEEHNKKTLPKGWKVDQSKPMYRICVKDIHTRHVVIDEVKTEPSIEIPKEYKVIHRFENELGEIWYYVERIVSQ